MSIDTPTQLSMKTGAIGAFRGACRTARLRVGRFLRSDAGPTAVEYAVMLSLIVVVCMSTIKTLGTNAKATFSNVASSLGTSGS